MSTFFDIFESYGWWGIIGILIAMLAYIGIKYLNKRVSKDLETGFEKVGEKLTDQMSKQNDQLVNTIITQQEKLVNYLIHKDENDSKRHNEMLNERMVLANDINIGLKDIMNIHNAQRAFILEFHNSNQNLSGIPFAKYSCNYEWFVKGLTPIGHRCINLSFGSIAHIVNDLLKSKNQQVVYTELEKMIDDQPTLSSLWKNETVNTVIYTGLFDKNNLLIGLLVLEYQSPVNTAKINMHQLNVQAAELTSILNLRYKYSKS